MANTVVSVALVEGVESMIFKKKPVAMEVAQCIHVRWMIRRDMQRVLEIQDQCYDWPWSEAEFRGFLKSRYIIGMVAEIEDQIVGYMVYELRRRSLDVLALAVDPGCRRCGVGRAMVDKLKSKLGADRRWFLRFEVEDRALDAHLFLRSMGCRAYRVVRDAHEDPSVDMYKFQFVCRD